MENKQLIQKADAALSDLSAGGLLNPEQSDMFIRNLIDQPTILSAVRSVPMRSPSMKVDKIGFGSRILRPASQTRATDVTPDQRTLAYADRSKPDFGQVELNTKEVIAEIRLPYEVLEDNIERGDLKNTLLALIAERAALDIEELILLGDTAHATDDYLALMDGVLKNITSNTVDGTDLGVTPQLFTNAIKAMPTRFRRDKRNMSFFVDMDIEQDYRQTITDRATGLGDTAVTGSQNIPVFGVPLVGNSLMPAGNMIFTNPKNILFGIQRDISIETDKDIRAREWIIVLTARVANAIEEELAAVKVSNIGAVTTP